MRTRIKFCGITRAEDAQIAARLGVDALGFVFYGKSPRAIRAEPARDILRQVPPFVTRVALFLDAGAEEVSEVIRIMNPDVLQFHGREPREFCAGFGKPYIKTLGMDGADDLTGAAAAYADAAAILLDSHVHGAPGGSGKPFDWSRAPRLPQPLILAGGLRADNVAQAVTALRPHGVDVSSGIEQSPGVKDETKMRDFVKEVRHADAA